MMLCMKGKFRYSLFILLIQWREFPALKLTTSHIYIILLSLNVTLFSKSLYLTVHIKTNYEKRCISRFSEKKHKGVFKTIATAKMELFVALSISFQRLTNFAKNPNISAVRVKCSGILYTVFWNFSRW